jgi:hypothetical protein
MKKKKCWDCGAIMKEVIGEEPNGFIYRHWRCIKCSREVLDMEQLEELAEKYRKMKSVLAKVSKWGNALAVRIPKEIIIAKKIKVGDKFRIMEDKMGLKFVLEKD